MYIQMISMHGLVRASDIEMGRDADTGGQIRYVIELIKNLSTYKDVKRIDLFTRQIKDKRVSSVYSQPIEKINPKCRIIRLPCGGSKYLRKEKLWPFLDEFADQMITFTRKEQLIPDIVHGHYADGGYVAMEIASLFGIPFLFTGHSLGYNKLDFLLKNQWTLEKANKEFHIDHRIEIEEEILHNADLVITSTSYERDILYKSYRNMDLPDYKVIPPGLNFHRFFPYYEYELPANSITEQQKQSYIAMLYDLQRFYLNPDKPLILTLCRPDARKNVDLLLKIYGEDPELRAIANLAIFAGIRDDINVMEDSEKQVLTDILLSMDRYDLYGRLAIPKRHDSVHDVPELYRIAALKRGIFVSTSYLENFGLTLIEASAAGLPFVAINNGGPSDIVENCHNGILVDLESPDALNLAIKKLLLDNEEWSRLSHNGIDTVRKFYSWNNHCDLYLKEVKRLLGNTIPNVNFIVSNEENIGQRLSKIKYLFITDVDDTLFGGGIALDSFRNFMEKNSEQMGFGVATGRPVASVRSLLKKLGLNNFDIIISSVGTEIYYGNEQLSDKGWMNHIQKNWKREKIHETLKSVPFIMLQQEEETQRKFKISYNLLEKSDPGFALPEIHNILMNARLSYNLIFSHGAYIDIIPSRASKGKAVRFLSSKWEIPFEKIITAGNSGNDKDMLTGGIYGIVVGNYEKDLESLQDTSRIYFAENEYVNGILEGLKQYNKTYQANLVF